MRGCAHSGLRAGLTPNRENAMTGPSDDRLAEIEIKLSFNEDLLDELNRSVARQQQRIADLEQLVRDLRLQLQRSLHADPGSSPHEIPPHY